jgi:hypothetical protein
VSAGFQRGARWGPAAALPRFSGQVRSRGGKGEWRAQERRVSMASWLPRDAWASFPLGHLQIRKWRDSAHSVFDEMTKFRNFEIFELGCVQ